MRRLRMAVVVGLGALALAPATPPAAAADLELAFSIREARAYGIHFPLRPEVITATGLRDEVQECDPAEDPYQCDRTRYNHRPNCPPAVEAGPNGAVPDVDPARGSERVTGGAGDDLGAGEAPPRSSPIALNDLLAVGSLGRFGSSANASGLASSSYVDLSGRRDPEAHAESDAFTPNARAWEERCSPREDVPDDFVHVLTRSREAPSTYSLAECRGRECTFFGGIGIGSDVERGRSIVQLSRTGDRVVGRLEAVLKDASWGGGQLTVDHLRTVVAFESDGTAEGLRWSVATTALGATLGGRPVTLPQGRIVGGQGLQVGVASPYVEAAGNGGDLQIVAPGLFVAHQEQSAFFAGAELNATFSRQPVTTFTFEDPDEVFGDTGGPDLTGGFDGGLPGPGDVPDAQPTGAPPTGPGVPEPAVSIVRLTTGTAPMVAILGLTGAALLLLLARWIGRYHWGRALYRVQPFRGLDWIYRAFLKS